MKNRPTYLEVSEYLKQIDGVLYRAKKKSGPGKVGTIAGCKTKDGYIRVKFSGKEYRAHHIVWLLATGSWPSQQLDHKNGNRADNRISNLRLCTSSQNSMNSTPRIEGMKGVTKHKQTGKFQAAIGVHGSNKYLGLFVTSKEAACAYDAACVKAFGEFARPNYRTAS